MELIYSPTAIEHIEFWKKSGNKQVQKRISELVNLPHRPLGSTYFKLLLDGQDYDCQRRESQQV